LRPLSNTIAAITITIPTPLTIGIPPSTRRRLRGFQVKRFIAAINAAAEPQSPPQAETFFRLVRNRFGDARIAVPEDRRSIGADVIYEAVSSASKNVPTA